MTYKEKGTFVLVTPSKTFIYTGPKSVINMIFHSANKTVREEHGERYEQALTETIKQLPPTVQKLVSISTGFPKPNRL